MWMITSAARLRHDCRASPDETKRCTIRGNERGRRLAPAVFLAVLCAGASASVLAQDACVPMALVPVGGEFQISGPITTSHRDSTVVAKKSGGFLVAWSYNDRGVSRLYGRNYSVHGTPTSADMSLMDFPDGHVYQLYGRPALLSRPNHGFQALWSGYFWTQTGPTHWTSHEGMVTRQYLADGAPANDYLPAAVNYAGEQAYPAIAETGFDNFVAVWSGNGTGDSNGVFQRQFMSNGEPSGDETRVNVTTANGQFKPRVASRPGVGYVVVWRGNGPGDSQGIFMRAFDPSGVPRSGEILVNTTTEGTQDTPDIAMARDGRFVVVWQGYAGNGDSKIYGQRFDRSRVRVGGEFEVNSQAGDLMSRPAVAMMPDGGFVVAGNGVGPGDNQGAFMRRFDEFGNSHAQLTLVNTTTVGTQSFPAIAAAPGGEVMVTWQGNGVAGDNQIYGQVFARPPRVFRSGFEGLDGSCPY